ncbi:MAG: nitroreductase family protein [Anaerolineales bacterium]|jgi:F420 biosynthesis protein FbiB-like protein
MSTLADSFYTLVRDRRSIRRFKDTPVSQTVLKRILKAGIQAPSAHNRQPWRFIVLQRPSEKESLASSMGEHLRADLERDGLSPSVIEQDVSRSYSRITGAALAILVCMDEASLDEYPDPKRKRAEHIMGVQSVAMAGENILLAAHAEGLGACWVCAPLFVPELVQEVLQLDADWLPQGMILLGYPADPGRSRGRRPIEEVTLWR